MNLVFINLIIIIMYIYALINTLSTYIIHINLNIIFYTRVEHSPTKTIYIKYYKKLKKHYTHTHTHTHARQVRATVGDSVLCCTCVMSFTHYLTPLALCVDSCDY